jgi:hypothetical protein
MPKRRKKKSSSPQSTSTNLIATIDDKSITIIIQDLNKEPLSVPNVLSSTEIKTSELSSPSVPNLSSPEVTTLSLPISQNSPLASAPSTFITAEQRKRMETNHLKALRRQNINRIHRQYMNAPTHNAKEREKLIKYNEQQTIFHKEQLKLRDVNRLLNKIDFTINESDEDEIPWCDRKMPAT